MSGDPADAERDGGLFIYDLDGVITTRDALTALVVERLRSVPRAAAALPHVVARLLAFDDARSTWHAKHIVAVAMRGLDGADYRAFASRFGARLGADPRWVQAGIVRQIQSQHASGATIVVATASEHHLASALLDRAGVPYDRLIATRVDGAASGLEIVDYRIGSRKAEALVEAGVPLERARFFTDSATDLPTARLTASVGLVGASKRTVERFRRAGVPFDVLAP